MPRRKKNKIAINILALLLLGVAIFSLFYFFKVDLPEEEENNPFKQVPEQSLLEIKDATPIIEDTEEWSISAIYPETKIEYIDQEIKAFVLEKINEFKNSILNSTNFIDNQDQAVFNIDYSFQRHKDRFLSFKFDLKEDTGGIHPNQEIFSFVFDLKEKKKITLNYLFITNDYLKIISEFSIQELKKSDFADEEKILSGAGPSLENYAIFSIAENSLIFYFPVYQVASAAAGEQSVAIPLSQIKNIINPDFFPEIGETIKLFAIESSDEGILLDSLKENDIISSPLNLSGMVAGNGWTGYEGQTGRVDLFDYSGNLMASSSLSAVTNWDQLPVKFKASLTFIVSEGTDQGYLIFYNENPSQKEENDKQIILPVFFEKQTD